ncbi:MAG TPA: HPF/RaiA family ribosome-associated protein [Vicinamibacterales bacterium]
MKREDSIVVRVHLNWLDFSPALRHHATECIDATLGPYASTIREVIVQVADADGPRRGPHDKRCDVEVLLRPFGALAASATATDAFAAVERAVRHARALVATRLSAEREQRGRDLRIA